MTVARSKRIEMTVDPCHVDRIRACLESQGVGFDLTVRPVISDWTSKRLMPFRQGGSKVLVRVTIDDHLIDPLVRAGFGILAMEVIPVSVTSSAV